MALLTSWAPMLESGPAEWLDRDWPWQTFGSTDLHLEMNPEWLVLADELEPGASGDLLGVLVTTGPATMAEACIDDPPAVDVPSLWVEYIAIAPWLRPDCPPRRRREVVLKLVGTALMMAAIARSKSLGLDGRIALHAEGDGARRTYLDKERWGMRHIGNGSHRTGSAYPVCFGDSAWAAQFGSVPRNTGRRSP